MALGGGNFLTQNKVMPGAYINFVSASRASANLSDRGYVAMPLILDWGEDGEVFEVTLEDVQKDSLKIFGYDYISPKLKGIRDIFKSSKVLYAYKLNSSGVKATNTIATAKCKGIRGNDITNIVEKNVDDADKFDVYTFVDDVKVDMQTVESATELVSNDFVDFISTAALKATAGLSMAGGTNGEVAGIDYQTFLDKIESYSFNTLGCTSTDDDVKGLFVSFTKRVRDNVGAKFQTVLYNQDADYEGIINVKNKTLDDGEITSSLVYWVTGASAGCAINKSNTNKRYDGEYIVDTDYKQSELEEAIVNGEFAFHKVGDEVHVVTDINSFVSFTKDKNSDFGKNQVIRVLDQVANDIAVLFNKQYLGKVQNNQSGRIAFWNDLVTYNKELERLQAIENVVSDEILVEKGNSKESVVVSNPITPVCAMEKLYMTVVVS